MYGRITGGRGKYAGREVGDKEERRGSVEGRAESMRYREI